MRQYFELDPKEKKQELLMLTFAILAFATVAKGLYNQYHNIDQDHILVPLLMTMFGGYFLVYGINGLTKGNLTPKWTPFYIFGIVQFLAKRIGSITQDKARIFSTKLLGTLGLIVSIVIFTFAITSWVN